MSFNNFKILNVPAFLSPQTPNYYVFVVTWTTRRRRINIQYSISNDFYRLRTLFELNSHQLQCALVFKRTEIIVESQAGHSSSPPVIIILSTRCLFQENPTRWATWFYRRRWPTFALRIFKLQVSRLTRKAEGMLTCS